MKGDKMERTQWKEKQIEKLEHRCENIYIDEGLKIYILDLIELAVSDCGTIYPHTMTFKAEYEQALEANHQATKEIKELKRKLDKARMDLSADE